MVSGEACRLYETRYEPASTENTVVNVSAHLQLALDLQLCWRSHLQMGYHFSTDRPCMKRNQRQDGLPPSWLPLARVSMGVCTRSITGCYGMRSCD